MTRRIESAALGLVAGVIAWLAFAYVPSGVYWSPDIGYKVIQAANVRVTPALDLAIAYPGQPLDPEFRFLPFNFNFYEVRQGRVYFAQPPIIAVLSQPFIRLLGDAGERVIPALAGLTCVMLVACLMKSLALQPAWAGVLLAGLATPLTVYSLFMWEHILAVALGLGAVAAFTQNRVSAKMTPDLISGALTGLAASLRKELLLLAVVLWLWQIKDRRWRAWLMWSIACGLPLLTWWAFAVVNNSSAIPPEFRVSTTPALTPNAYLLRAGWEALADFLFDPRYGRTGDWLMVALLVYGMAHQVRQQRMREAIQSAALAAVLIGVWFTARQTIFSGSGLFGLLSASPVMMLGWFGGTEETSAARTLRAITLTFAALVALALSLFTEAGPYQPGLEWGARFALIVFPLSAPLAVRALRLIAARAAQSWLARLHFALALALIAAGAAIQMIGVSLMRNPAVTIDARAALLALPEMDVVTNEWWLSAAAPRLYLTKRMFLIRDEPGLSDWMRAAFTQGVRRFAFVGYRPLSESIAVGLAPPGLHLAVTETRALSNQMFVTHVVLQSK
jgi:hypothetical protein